MIQLYVCIYVFFLIFLPTVVCYIEYDFLCYTARLCCLSIIPICVYTHTHTHNCLYLLIPNLSGGSVSRESTCNAGDPESIPGRGRSPGEGNGYPLQYPCLGKPMDRGAWCAPVHRVAKSRMRLKQLHWHQCQTLSPSLSHHCLWQLQICSL